MDGATGPRGRRSCWRSSSSFSRRHQPWEPRRQRGASPAPIWRAMSLSAAQSASDRLGGRGWGRVERGERCNGSAAQGPGPLDSSASAPHAGLCSCVSGHFQSPLALPLRRARSASAASTPLRAHRAPPEPIGRGISAAPLPMAHRTSSHLHVIDINRESRAPITSCAFAVRADQATSADPFPVGLIREPPAPSTRKRAPRANFPCFLHCYAGSRRLVCACRSTASDCTRNQDARKPAIQESCEPNPSV